MAITITAEFETRRDAEMSVERLVQERGLDREAIEIVSASDLNTAGTIPAGSDLEDGHEKTATEGDPQLPSKIKVSATIEEAQAGAVTEAFRSYGATDISR